MEVASPKKTFHCWLLEVRGTRPGKQVQLFESEMCQLCVVSKGIFMQQPNLLELEAHIKICALSLSLSLSLSLLYILYFPMIISF
ncbi:hypothetical protein AMTRI_Chr10g230420 [Amborella trichopoda]